MIKTPDGVIALIEKEEVTKLHFPNEEVLLTSEAGEQRLKALKQAMVLGNTYKGKAKLIFEDSEKKYLIDTHIWGLTDKRVILKQGIVIPIHRIHEVKL